MCQDVVHFLVGVKGFVLEKLVRQFVKHNVRRCIIAHYVEFS